VSAGIVAGSEAVRQVFQGEFVPPKVTRSRASGTAPPMLLGVFFVLWLLSRILGSFAGGMLGAPVGTGRHHRGGYIGGVGGFSGGGFGGGGFGGGGGGFGGGGASGGW
jgi:uncharacterized protein